MTKAPDNIPQFIGNDDQLINAMKHMLTRGNLTITDKSVVAEAVDTIEAMRADPHAELVKAADELAEASQEYIDTEGLTIIRMWNALTAYKQAKEKTK